MKFQEVLDFATKASHIKVWVDFNANEGAYINVPKKRFIKALEESRDVLEGYGEVDAYRNGKTLVVG